MRSNPENGIVAIEKGVFCQPRLRSPTLLTYKQKIKNLQFTLDIFGLSYLIAKWNLKSIGQLNPLGAFIFPNFSSHIKIKLNKTKQRLENWYLHFQITFLMPSAFLTYILSRFLFHFSIVLFLLHFLPLFFLFSFLSFSLSFFALYFLSFQLTFFLLCFLSFVASFPFSSLSFFLSFFLSLFIYLFIYFPFTISFFLSFFLSFFIPFFLSFFPFLFLSFFPTICYIS